MTHTDERVEEFQHTVWYSRLKEFDRTTDDEEERDYPTEMFIDWLTTYGAEMKAKGREEGKKDPSSVIVILESLIQFLTTQSEDNK